MTSSLVIGGASSGVVKYPQNGAAASYVEEPPGVASTRREDSLGGPDSGGLLEPELFDRRLAHLEFLDLAGDRHRKRIDELPVARDLVARDLAFAPSGDLIARGRGPLAQLDPGHDLLAVFLRRHADDLDVRDVGVAVKEFLDLARIDVLAPADDHVLDPADDVDVAVGVHRREVARVHPPGGVDRLTCRVFVVPVAAHDDVPAAAELAGRVARNDRARARIDDLDLDVRVNPADGRYAALERAVGRALRGYRRRFCHAVRDRHLGDVHHGLDLLH